MVDILPKTSLEGQAVILMIFLMIYLVVKEDVAAADLNQFSKIYLVEVDLDVRVEMIFCMNVISPWRMY